MSNVLYNFSSISPTPTPHIASLSVILGIIGNLISILVFAFPRKSFKQMVKKKSTENFNGLPYITTLLSTSLWSFYGLLKPGGLLVLTVNGAGVAFYIVYVSLFLVYAPKNVKVKSIKLVGILDVIFLAVAIAVVMLAFRGGMRIKVVGILCTVLAIVTYAAPLCAMRTVIQTKSVKYMPLSLTFFQFLNGGVWFAYAVLVKDIYIGIPNGVGIILGSVQLVLYIVYRNKSSVESEDIEEEDVGSAHLFKGFTQMNDLNETSKENKSLNKGFSLPKPCVVKQYSHKIMKTISLNPYELDIEEEDVGSAHLFKGFTQMNDLNETSKENKSLNKGFSLPKPSVVKQYNHKIMKTISFNPYELGLQEEKDIENGLKEEP